MYVLAGVYCGKHRKWDLSAIFESEYIYNYVYMYWQGKQIDGIFTTTPANVGERSMRCVCVRARARVCVSACVCF